MQEYKSACVGGHMYNCITISTCTTIVVTQLQTCTTIVCKSTSVHVSVDTCTIVLQLVLVLQFL